MNHCQVVINLRQLLHYTACVRHYIALQENLQEKKEKVSGTVDKVLTSASTAPFSFLSFQAINLEKCRLKIEISTAQVLRTETQELAS